MVSFWSRLVGRESHEKAVQQAQEHRSYTDALTQLYEARIAGSEGTGDVMVTAAAEAAVGLWGRCIAAATVSPEDRGLTPKVLGQVGRELIRRGESVWRIMVTDGGVRLRPACAWTVHGSPAEETWTYELTFAGPDNQQVITVRGDSVLHFRTGVSPEAPWRGRSPLARASMSSSLAGYLELRLYEEGASQTGRFIPLPSTAANTDSVEAAVQSMAGRTLLVPTTQASWSGTGTTNSPTPRSDWSPQRVGADPPQALVQLRHDAIRSIWQAAGVPAGLLEGSDGQGMREMTRQFIHTTLNPVLREMEAEATAKLDRTVTFSLEALGATDLVGRARAMGSLVTAGMLPLTAARLTDFNVGPSDFAPVSPAKQDSDSG